VVVGWVVGWKKSKNSEAAYIFISQDAVLDAFRVPDNMRRILAETSESKGYRAYEMRTLYVFTYRSSCFFANFTKIPPFAA